MSEPLALIPWPVSVEETGGEFALTAGTVIVTEGDGEGAGAVLGDMLRPGTGLPLAVRRAGGDVPEGSILLTTTRGGGRNEGYSLVVDRRNVTVAASQAAGLLRGIQTLRQLLKTPDMRRAPCVRIDDVPRFPWRGLHLDSCRHFMSVDCVVRLLDACAFHKLNRFHWHLTEDQGWRLESRKYPRLVEVGAWRTEPEGRYGGFYSRDDVARVVQHAWRLGITVVPEIEMPGHCTAALASYPDLSCTGGPFAVPTGWGVFKDVYCAGNDAVFEFLGGVLEEALVMFPGPYVHIGADEVPKDRWKACPRCQARLKAEGLKDEFALQTWFVGRIARELQRWGRQVICWDEVLEGGAPPGVLVQAWRGHEHGRNAVLGGSDAIVSPYSHVYLDYSVEDFGLRNIYGFNPVPGDLPENLRGKILGSEACTWTEGITESDVDQRIFPRLSGLAEVLWSGPGTCSWEDFLRRLGPVSRRLDQLGIRVGPAGPL